MCNNNQITKLAPTITKAAFLINSFSCNQTVLIITIKSGFLQLTISTRKNDFTLRNIVFEKNNPINRATNPDINVKIIIDAHPHCPKIMLLTNANTITFALQAINGVIRMETIFSFRVFVLLAIIIAGTLQPNPVNKLTILRPLIPNLSNVRSNNTDTLDKTPT
jgi:hypothetical protein